MFFLLTFLYFSVNLKLTSGELFLFFINAMEWNSCGALRED
ncbi:hypothetical protein HMPREF0454_01545 [Hafnia alvei ATCC 51873]|uniref:Uncharacterized protein n=1 Tax=Hafnia alvei ATCC 51873 TaxID=1002364 RepID=G9Y4X2_HAFAL|nr:hypothetical protein HMPREF0454_01545 [Hafnia alvei ATCC 51873]